MDRKSAIYRFCNYQERSQQEVKDRLYDLGSYPEEIGQLIAELIETGLVNEERFAKAFVRGRFKLKKWGRIKITHELKHHKISPYILKAALKEIDANEYFGTAQKLAAQKWEMLSAERNAQLRRSKVYRYLLQKGYEASIIAEVLKNIIPEK